MTDHVMDTDRVRALFVEADTFGTNDAEIWAESAAAFDAWLAAHDRKVRADALRREAEGNLRGTKAGGYLLITAGLIESGEYRTEEQS